MTQERGSIAAVDLGATSGRVMLGRFDGDALQLEQVARFPNGPVEHPDGLHWDVSRLLAEVRAGLATALRREPGLRSIGIDSWACDYALLTGDRMLGEPFHYRDARTEAAVPAVHERISAAELYARNGLQHLPFNTLFQLEADKQSGALDRADRLLLIPDLIADSLTGVPVAERTNASTTGLLDVSTREWDEGLITLLGMPRSLFAPLIDPGTLIGPAAEFGDVEVISVGSHDTASAVVGVPAAREDFAYISCGTWGLVGVELEHPVLGEASRLAGFTNEGGVDGRVRYLHNVMGLWLLSESVREWERQDGPVDLNELLAQAAATIVSVPVFDADDPVFLAPAGMPDRIVRWFVERGVEPPHGRAEITRSIIESLAETFGRTVERAAELSGRDVAVVHIVGGGSQNDLLCQLTADRSGLPVLAGPVEATAIGNILVQGRAGGLLGAGRGEGSLEALRTMVARSHPPREYRPRVRNASRR